METKTTRLDPYVQKIYNYFIKNIIRVISLKISAIVITLRNINKNYNRKKRVEITMEKSIYKINIKCMKSGNKYRASEIQR